VPHHAIDGSGCNCYDLSVTFIGDEMPDLTFDFTWYKDRKGYRLIPAKPSRRRSILDAKAGDVQPARIVRNGGTLQSYRPLEFFPNLFSRFIDMAKSENGVLEFVEKFGPLTHDGLRRDGDVVPAVIDQAENMSQVLRGRIIAMPLNSLNASLVTERNDIRLKVSPACLIDALWLQLAQAKSVTNFRECPQCHRSFMTGRRTNRRADAKFCSIECKTKFHSLERSR
jgi:hypothetical protein